MTTKNEVFYECGPDDDFEEIENEETNQHQTKVSFIPDDAQGRVLQQAFSLCPKSDNETLKEKYNRLRSELVLIHERINYENQKSKDMKQQHVDDIQTYLMALKNTSSDKSKIDFSDPNAQRLAALNNRVQDLEWTLGINNAQQSSSSTTPLVKALEELKVRISILSSELVARINKRIQESSYEMKSARSDVSTDSGNIPHDDKSIVEMHELIKRWDTSCKELPNVVGHLTASRQLHEDAERVCRKYAQFMSLKADIEKSLHFQQKFDELNTKQNNERIASIQERISALNQ